MSGHPDTHILQSPPISGSLCILNIFEFSLGNEGVRVSSHSNNLFRIAVITGGVAIFPKRL